MTSLSSEILQNYQVRKTNKQKLAFISLLQKHFPQLTIEESHFPKCRNLIVGDLENAKVVLTAHYDTCARSPLPNFIAPKNPLLSLLYSVIMSMPGLVLALLIFFLLKPSNLDPLILCAISFGIYTLYMLFLIFGPANKHTANDNTSGVIVLCELLQILNETERAKIAFVFFDHEESGLIGSSHFRSKHSTLMKDKLLINLDCVSDGEHIMVSASKRARNQYGSLLKSCFLPSGGISVLFCNSERTLYPSDQMGFKTSIAIAALKHKPLLGYYMNRVHTSRDIIFEKKNIVFICNSILQIVKKL